MRDAAREPSDGLHLLRLPELFLEIDPVGDVDNADQQVFPAVDVVRRGPELDGAGLAIQPADRRHHSFSSRRRQRFRQAFTPGGRAPQAEFDGGLPEHLLERRGPDQTLHGRIDRDESFGIAFGDRERDATLAEHRRKPSLRLPERGAACTVFASEIHRHHQHEEGLRERADISDRHMRQINQRPDDGEVRETGSRTQCDENRTSPVPNPHRPGNEQTIGVSGRKRDVQKDNHPGLAAADDRRALRGRDRLECDHRTDERDHQTDSGGDEQRHDQRHHDPDATTDEQREDQKRESVRDQAKRDPHAEGELSLLHRGGVRQQNQGGAEQGTDCAEQSEHEQQPLGTRLPPLEQVMDRRRAEEPAEDRVDDRYRSTSLPSRPACGAAATDCI